MKRFLLIILTITSISSFSQHNKKRQLLRNEASKKDMTVERNTSAYNYGRHHRRTKPSYSLGDSEVFLKISRQGYFTVEVDNQMMSNPHGKFRFFEINSGSRLLSIYHDGFLVYRTPISVPHSSRIILDFSYNGLYLLDVYPVSHQDNIWIDDIDTPNNFEMSPEQFHQFKYTLKHSTHFDEEKIKQIDMQLSTGTLFNTLQIREILQVFGFESNRLKTAKKLYDYCVDPNNYFTVADALEFISSKRELSDYIAHHRR